MLVNVQADAVVDALEQAAGPLRERVMFYNHKKHKDFDLYQIYDKMNCINGI